MANNEGTPLHGDRSAWNTTEHAAEHARDIDDDALLRHLPAPSAAGTYARDNGTNWVAQLGLLLADLTGYVRGAIILGGAAAWEALTIGAANTVLKSDGTDVTWGNVAHSELSGVGTSDHHDPVTLDANADAVLSLSTQEVGLAVQSANEVFAGPASGADAAPTFRGLVADDLPAHTHVETDITDLDHTDDDAIHDNVAGEIHAIAAKATPVDADELVIEDSADSWAKKRVALSTLLGGGGASALDDLSDVDAAAPNNGDVLTFDDGSGDWVAAAPTGGSGSGSAASDPVFHVAGALTVATDVNGVWIAPRGATIQYVYIYCRDPGSAGSTIVDVNLNGTSIFDTTQANRPTLAYDDADQVAKSGAPDTTALVENDVLSIDIDQVGTDAEDLTVIVALEVTPTDAADITYTPAVAADWDSDVDPGDVDDALDQLAERVDDLEGGGGGASAFTDLTDTPADYTDHAGKYVRVNADEDGVEFTSDLLTMTSEIDAPPASPNAMDDEFNDGSFSTTLWTWLDQGGASATETNNALLVTLNENANRIRGIYQVTPAGTWKFRAKLHSILTAAADRSYIALIAGVDAASAIYGIGLWNVNTLRGIVYATPSSTASTWGSSFSLYAAFIYVELEWDGSYLIARANRHGIGSWMEVTRQALGSAPAIIGLGFENNRGHEISYPYEWFRRVA